MPPVLIVSWTVACHQDTTPPQVASHPCRGVPVLDADGAPTGITRCWDGALDRTFAATCDIDLAVDCPDPYDCSGCGAGERCLAAPNRFWGCSCARPCATDADCAADEACLCPSDLVVDPFPHCVYAECRTGADCASRDCGVSRDPACDTWLVELACRDAERDTCHSDDDCGWPEEHLTCRIGGPWEREDLDFACREIYGGTCGYD